MENALIIAAFIACIFFILFTLVAIGTISSIKKFFEKAEKNLDTITNDFHSLKIRINQSLDEFSEVKFKTAYLIDEVTKLKGNVAETLSHVNTLSSSIEKTSDTFEKNGEILFRMLEPMETLTRMITAKVAAPLVNTISIASAAYKAVSAFSSTLFKRKSN